MGQHGKHRPLVRLALLAWLAWAGLAAAQCRLALVVGIDVSSSVDAEEDALQRQGLARALRSEPVRRAALALPEAPVALAVFEWSGRWQQAVIADWTLLTDASALEGVAAQVAGSRRVFSEFPTAAGYALGYAATLLGRAPDCLFRTVDLSGDGISNDGFGPALAYEYYDYAEVTVNGLPITGHDAGVVTFYADQVVYGPGAFYEVAEDFEDFERAMRRKLEREMSVLQLGETARPVDGPSRRQ